MEKITTPNELYQAEFLAGLEEALADVKLGRLEEVKNFEDFIHDKKYFFYLE